jgi:hypothetical protein
MKSNALALELLTTWKKSYRDRDGTVHIPLQCLLGIHALVWASRGSATLFLEHFLLHMC